MEIITNTNVSQYVVNGTWSINGSAKPDNSSDASESKRFNLNVKFSNVPLGDVIRKSLDPTKITWCNNVFRPNIGNYTNGQTITIDFKSPASAPQLDPIEQLTLDAIASGIDPNDTSAIADYIMNEFKTRANNR